MIKVAAYTNGGIEVASCRLRSFYLFKKAEEFSQQIIDNARNVGFLTTQMYETIDLGYIFFEQDKLDQAESCYLKVVEPFKKAGDNHKLCQAYVRLSELYLKWNDPDKALVYALDAEKIMSPDLTRQSQVYRALGKIYAALGNIDRAEICFKKSER